MTDAYLKLSGGPIAAFDGGWAVIPFGARAHLWRLMEHQDELRAHFSAPPKVSFYEARCGHCQAATDRAPPLAPGDFPKCKRCERSEAAA